MRKNLYIALFLGLIVLQSGGLLLLLKGVQYQISNAHVQSLNFKVDGKLNFSFSLKEYEQYKVKDSEFKFKGRMYDVQKKYSTKDSIHLTAFVDAKEEKIIKAIDALCSVDGANKYFPQLKIVHLKNLQYVLMENEFSVNNNVEKLNWYFQYLLKKNTLVYSLDTPPPELV